MSNILTDCVRFMTEPDRPLDERLAHEIARVLVGRGSYWVPVRYALSHGGRVMDLQYGGAKCGDNWPSLENDGWCRAAWHRHGDEGLEYDTIKEFRSLRYGTACRYGFDRVEMLVRSPDDHSPPWPDASVERHGLTLILNQHGSYQASNDRSLVSDTSSPRDEEILPGTGLPDLTTATSTTGPDYRGLVDVEPEQLRYLEAPESLHPRVASISLRWRGRAVHRIDLVPDERDPDVCSVAHHSADGWDNCRHLPYLEDMIVEELLPLEDLDALH